MDFKEDKKGEDLNKKNNDVVESKDNQDEDSDKNNTDKLSKDEEYKKKIMNLFDSVDEENFDIEKFMKDLGQIGKERSKVKFYGTGLLYNLMRFLISFVLLFACTGFFSSFIEITHWYNALIYTLGASLVITIINLIFRCLPIFKINVFVVIFIKYILIIIVAIILNMFVDIGFRFDRAITIICYYLIYYALSALFGLLIYKNNFLIRIR